MKKLPLLALLVAFTACGGPTKTGPSRVENPSSLISKAKLLKGEDDVKVEVLELTSGEDALVKVQGTRSQFEGLVVEAKIVDNANRISYQTQVHGRTWNVVVRDKKRSTWRSYLGAGYRDGVRLTLVEDGGKDVDVVAMYRQYEDQKHDGRLDKLARFDRKDEEGDEMKDLTDEVKRMNEACESDVSVSVAWNTIDDDTLKSLSISSYCSGPADALRYMCKHKPAREFVKNSVKKIACRYGKASKVAIKGGTLTWTTSKKSVNMTDFNRDALHAQKIGDLTLKQHITLAETDVCTNGDRSRYIVVAPEEAKNPGVLYGDGKKFTRTRGPKTLGKGWFLEPRLVNPRYNKNIRGYNLQTYSKVDIDNKKNTCKLVCGTRSKDMTLLSPEDALKIAANVSIAPDPHPREPYALARDRRGVYYYVERSTEPGKERFFQLYVGKKGNLKLQQMRDIVSDSEGEIFSSKKGELRLVLDKGNAVWIKGKRKSPLTLVPVRDNLSMIYNDLGVYTGKQLGTPCDDFDMD